MDMVLDAVILSATMVNSPANKIKNRRYAFETGRSFGYMKTVMIPISSLFGSCLHIIHVFEVSCHLSQHFLCTVTEQSQNFSGFHVPLMGDRHIIHSAGIYGSTLQSVHR